jgi:hypothetical protein
LLNATFRFRCIACQPLSRGEARAAGNVSAGEKQRRNAPIDERLTRRAAYFARVARSRRSFHGRAARYADFQRIV